MKDQIKDREILLYMLEQKMGKAKDFLTRKSLKEKIEKASQEKELLEKEWKEVEANQKIQEQQTKKIETDRAVQYDAVSNRIKSYL